MQKRPSNLIFQLFSRIFLQKHQPLYLKIKFPSYLKLADATTVYKKKSKNSKDDYRPVSILTNFQNLRKIYLWSNTASFNSFMFKYQCVFCRGYNAHHCLITLIEKRKKSVENGGAFGTTLTDLSKGFDCLPHELLIAKLHA